MELKIYYYGIFSKIAGKSMETIDFNGKSLKDLKEFLKNRYPDIGDAIISINFRTFDDDHELHENDEIVVMAPGPWWLINFKYI